MLGVREPGIYGKEGLNDIKNKLESLASEHSANLEFFQSNAEHELIDQIHAAFASKIDFIIFNPAAFTHTSIALRDSLLSTKIPFIEIHLSNVHARENFRKHSYFSDIALGVICGFGSYGYEMALHAAICQLNN
jgi:3-dehydroquinate dehydratase-2